MCWYVTNFHRIIICILYKCDWFVAGGNVVLLLRRVFPTLAEHITQVVPRPLPYYTFIHSLPFCCSLLSSHLFSLSLFLFLSLSPHPIRFHLTVCWRMFVSVAVGMPIVKPINIFIHGTMCCMYACALSMCTRCVFSP